MSFLVEETPQAEVYESSQYSFKAVFSNRHGNKIEIYCALSNRSPYFVVPASRYEDTLEKLRSGADPDQLAKEFPID